MRWVWLCIFSAVTASLAAAQVWIQPSGYATPDGSPSGVTTPQIAFVNASNSPVGATNASGNNLAGARNSTIGSVPALSYASTVVPVYIQSTSPESSLAYEEALSAEGNRSVQRGVGSMRTFSAYSNGPDSLAALARTARETRPRKPTARVYTDTDLQRLAEQYMQTGSPTLSMVRSTAPPDTAAAAAQAALDRNLGFRTAPQPTAPQPEQK